MLTIICGEDSSASRKYFLDLKTEYRDKGFELQNIAPKDIVDQITKSDQTVSLFGNKIAFFTENLNTLIARSGSESLLGEFETLSKAKDIEIVDWEEDKQSRELKIIKLGKLKEFKPSENIFQLLDSLVPGNKNKFILLLDNLCGNLEEIFIFTMISRHLRSLILAKNNNFSAKIQPWQRGKLISQAKPWEIKKLMGFYEGLFRIDRSVKTSSNPNGIKGSLDILACFYL